MEKSIDFEKYLKDIRFGLAVIVFCLILQTCLIIGDRISSTANASSGIITDVNIVQIDGQRINSPYVRPISVKIK